MYDFDTLEKRCKKHYRKKYFLIFAPLFFFIISIISYMIIFHKEGKIVHSKSIKVEKKVIIKKKKILPYRHTSQKVKDNKCYCLQFFVAKEAGIKYLYLNEKKLKKLGFDCYIHKGESLLHLQCNDTKDVNNLLKLKELARKNKLDFVTKRISCLQKKVKSKKIEKTLKPEAKPQSTFLLKSKKFNVTNLKKLFKERQSYNLALKIARSYYNTQDYADAVVWAKKANGIDKTDAQSWIVYAKSLYNIGDKVKAKKILNIYLQFENSNQINEILSKWKSQ